jgi:hypothetical protein
MYKYSLFSDGVSVGIHSKTDLQSIFAKWNKLIHFTGVEVSLGGHQEFVVEYNNIPDNEVFYSGKQVHINIPFEKLETGELLFYSALPFLEVQRQRSSAVTMHAAAVEFLGKAVLLLGKSGAGKTSIALSLCLNHGAQLIGNDILIAGIVDGNVTVGSGNKFLRLRKESVKRNMPKLLNLFPVSEKDPWTHKIDCLPETLGIDTCNANMSIGRSYLVHVDNTMEKLYVANANTMDTRLYLNENMSRYIRGTAIAIFGESSQFMGYVPSYDLPNFFRMRIKLAEKVITETEIIYVSGSLNDICQYIISEK